MGHPSAFDSLEAEADAYEEQMLANGFLKPVDRWWRTSPSRVERPESSSGLGRHVPSQDRPQKARPDEYVSLARAAEITGLSEKVVRRAINDGELPAAWASVRA